MIIVTNYLLSPSLKFAILVFINLSFSSEISKNTNLHQVFVDKRQASPGDCKIYENYRT